MLEGKKALQFLDASFEVDAAQAKVAEAERKLKLAICKRDAILQEAQIRDQMKQGVTTFSPDVFNALSPRDIRYITTGE